jgi:IMP dehydrogenase
MGSVEAMETGSKDRYFQDVEDDVIPEGIVGRVPYKGEVKRVCLPIGGLRAGMGYWFKKTFLLCKKTGRFVLYHRKWNQ